MKSHLVVFLKDKKEKREALERKNHSDLLHHFQTMWEACNRHMVKCLPPIKLLFLLEALLSNRVYIHTLALHHDIPWKPLLSLVFEEPLCKTNVVISEDIMVKAAKETL